MYWKFLSPCLGQRVSICADAAGRRAPGMVRPAGLPLRVLSHGRPLLSSRAVDAAVPAAVLTVNASVNLVLVLLWLLLEALRRCPDYSTCAQ